MHLVSFATLVALASCVAAATFPQAPPQQYFGLTPGMPNAIYILDTSGPINFHYHYLPPIPPPVPLPAEPLNTQTVGGMLAVVVLASLCVYLGLLVFSRWSSDSNSTIASTQPVRAGRRGAVAEAQLRTTSRIAQLAFSADQTHANDSTKPSLPTEPSSLRVLRLANVEPESTFLPEGSSSIASTLLPRRYRCCTFRHQCCAALRNKVIWRGAKLYPGIHQVIIGNPEAISDAGDEVPPSPRSSTGRSRSNSTPLIKSFIGPPIVHEILNFSVLVVALDWSHDRSVSLPGVTHDTRWFKRMCSDLESSVALHILADATRDIIRSKILEMHKNAQPGTAIVVYLNGHGNGNSFMLYDYASVDAATLVGWITEIRTETTTRLPVCIVFDHCRFESRTPPYVNLGQGIHVLWASMPGQRSADLKMAGDDNAYIPCSNFLKVLTLVLAEARTSPAGFADCLMSRMNAWMDFVARMTRAEECRKEDCPAPCPMCGCPSYESCTHVNTRSRHQNELAYPRTQNPNGMFHGIEDCVCISELLQLIEPTAKLLFDRFQETAETIMKQDAYSAVKNNQVPAGESNLFQPSSSPTRRGRSTGAVAVSTRPLPI